MKRLTIVALAILVLGSVAKAQPNAQPNAQAVDFQKLGFTSETEMQNYFNVVDVKVTETALDARQLQALAPSAINPTLVLGNDILGTLGPVLLDPSGVAGWIAFGKKAWEIVVANRPVVNVQTTRISVLPNDRALWTQMSGWRGPGATSYSIQAINGFGIVVVNQKYTVSYNYGGQLAGKGRYLANVTVIPTIVDVSWGYTLNSSVEVGQILNTGTVESPVPGVDLQLKYDTKTILKDSQGVDSFFVKGDGSLAHVSN